MHLIFFLFICHMAWFFTSFRISYMVTTALLPRTLTWFFLILPENAHEYFCNTILQYEDLRQLCVDPRARAAVLADMDAVGKQAQLRGFEFAKAVTLVLEPFTMENGLLTPTFKIKRPQAKAYYAKAIADMYAELSASEPSSL
ncbi:uncharacterized protein A4U43_C02F18220 [Asparagus officinalis]|uniref:AMP-binding enzyme C-terminal domain-containing protein n=1 Tax=Asparagus officinalis TaxID=4686 RepID=A0A5P1FJX1_ASPOF|nr:long chain acyl-CoA synthetase 6, peroxisomal-like [Asparagus officinalis]ONK78384.1 uncharacterized protein A4U43_C02F18220 [Asparagus officinalis]